MSNSRFKISALILSGLICINNPVISIPLTNNNLSPNNAKLTAVDCNEVILDLNADKVNEIEISDQVEELKTNIFESEEDMMKDYFQTQKKMDIEDIKILWGSTVERNPVIKFALKKLSLPAEQRRVHSSMMGKTLATLISGASILPSVLGADGLTSSAVSAGGSLASRAVATKDLPKEMPLTDAELIQLARLVEELQDKLVENYYEYKSNLEAYKLVRKEIVDRNRAYSDAIDSNNFLSIVSSKVLYDRAESEELLLKQKIKLNRLELERLAGEEPVKNLALGKALSIEDFKELNAKEACNTKQNNLQKIEAVNNSNKFLTAKIVSDYCEEDIKVLAEEIYMEIEEEQSDVLADLNILWAAAVDKSETIRFALFKLSKPEGEVEKKGIVKKILSPLASVAPIIGIGVGDPVTATGAIMGGGVLSAMLSDDSKLNAKLSRVTDADLVLLAQETDNLQQKLVKLYFEYITSRKELKNIEKLASERFMFVEASKDFDIEAHCVANVFYKDLIDLKNKINQKVVANRIALEQFVGNDAIYEVDKNIKKVLK